MERCPKPQSRALRVYRSRRKPVHTRGSQPPLLTSVSSDLSVRPGLYVSTTSDPKRYTINDLEVHTVEEERSVRDSHLKEGRVSTLSRTPGLSDSSLGPRRTLGSR